MIHSSSNISKDAKIGKNVKIGPFCSVGDSVVLENDVELVSNVHIEGNTKVGKGTKIYPFASIGTTPQDLKYNNEPNSLIIGENNNIREHVTINPGTEGGGGKTIIGNNCLFMISSHIAHDCKVGNDVIIANNVPLGGHVTIEDSVIIGGNSAVQQFTRIGRLAMIGGMTGVLKDVIPFGLSIGNRNYLQGLNLIGLRRKNYDNKKIMELNKAYKEIFFSKNLHENLNKINSEFKDNELVEEVVKTAKRKRQRRQEVTRVERLLRPEKEHARHPHNRAPEHVNRIVLLPIRLHGEAPHRVEVERVKCNHKSLLHTALAIFHK